MLLALVLLLGGPAGFVYYRASASLPPREGAFRLRGLTAPVEIVRDAYGIPHVFGSTLVDLARAAGYVHAQDRLFQMDLARRMGAGRLAEILGGEALPHDRQVRRLGLAQAAERELERMDPEARGLLEAYTAGVNGFIESSAGRLPPEFRILGHSPSPWRPQDSLVIGKWLNYVLSYNASVELLRAHLAEKFGIDAAYRLTGLAPPQAPVEGQTKSAPTAPLPARLPIGSRPGSGASNAWVVSGGRSSSGKPLLASDPHLSLSLPSVWYQLHLSGGGVNVAGATLPGLPLVLIGHNERVAWGVTALFADVQDHYVERVNPANPKEYAVGESWEAFETSEETIAVKDAAPVKLDIKRTRHGIVVSDAPRDGRILSLRWDGLSRGDGVLAFLRLNRATGWTEFTEALRSLAGPPLAFLYADVDGNIGFFPAGEIPLRAGHDGALPVDGASSAFEWQGLLAHESKPFIFNPESGYIVSANHTMTPPEASSSFGLDALAPFRANRITALLTAAAKLNPADFERIQSDRYDSSTEPVLRHLVAMAPEPGDAALAQQLLRGWDGQMRGGAPAAVYQASYLQILENTFRDDLGDDLYREFLTTLELGYPGGVFAIIEDPRAPWWDDRTTPLVEDRTAILGRSLAGALRQLRTLQGDDPARWDWATLHGIRFEHPLGRKRPLDFFFNRGPVPFGGSTFTVANAIVSLEKPYDTVAGTSFRMVADLADLGSATSVIPAGASGHLLSPHYFDQNGAWVSGKSLPLLFDRAQIDAASTGKLTLNP